MKTTLQMPLVTRKSLSVAAMQQRQLSTAVIVTTGLSQHDKDELHRYRLREQRAASAEIASDILAESSRKHHARLLHQERTAHVRDNTQDKPQKVTITNAYVHTTLALNSVMAVPLKLPLWQRLWNWLRTE